MVPLVIVVTLLLCHHDCDVTVLTFPAILPQFPASLRHVTGSEVWQVAEPAGGGGDVVRTGAPVRKMRL